jgi:hypothetical protein
MYIAGREGSSSTMQRNESTDRAVWRAQVLDRDPVCRRCGVRRSVIAYPTGPVHAGRCDSANGMGLCLGCYETQLAEAKAHGLPRGKVSALLARLTRRLGRGSRAG